MGGQVTESVYCVYCETEGINKFFKGETPAETCPTNGSHTVTTDSLTVVPVKPSAIVAGEDGKIYEILIDSSGVIDKREIT